MSIRCCRNCVPPKRHLGCHDRCKEYLEEKAEDERIKEKTKFERKLTATKFDFNKIGYANRRPKK